MKIIIVAGARPNFMKIAPIIAAIREHQLKGDAIEYKLVHTGQHYDKKLSDTFFEQLGIPKPDVNLGVGSGTQAEQTAAIMVKFEKFLTENPADMVIVVGDVTSTMACSIVAKKMNTAVAHVEAGIRSFDLSMPEEINRMVTDALADYFFTTTEIANENLRRAGIADSLIFFVGNTMIDTLLKNINRLQAPPLYAQLQLRKDEYFVITLHRPSNVDDPEKLRLLLNEILQNSHGMPVIFPVHPRTAKNLETDAPAALNLHLVEPLSYLEFIYLVKHARAVITDSGGIQEETTVLGIPCLTLRDNTERPETVTLGTNELIGSHPEAIAPAMQQLMNKGWKTGTIPQYWDGHAAQRIVNALLAL